MNLVEQLNELVSSTEINEGIGDKENFKSFGGSLEIYSPNWRPEDTKHVSIGLSSAARGSVYYTKPLELTDENSKAADKEFKEMEQKLQALRDKIDKEVIDFMKSYGYTLK